MLTISLVYGDKSNVTFMFIAVFVVCITAPGLTGIVGGRPKVYVLIYLLHCISTVVTNSKA